jgi:hypothetical protein
MIRCGDGFPYLQARWSAFRDVSSAEKVVGMNSIGDHTYPSDQGATIDKAHAIDQATEMPKCLAFDVLR